MAGAFAADSLDRSYAFLDACPENLFDDVVTLPVGSLAQRVEGARRWRDALLAGRLPDAETWPPPQVAAPVRRALLDMGLLRFCTDQPELVDALMKDILAAFARQADAVSAEVAERLAELEELERARLAEQAHRRGGKRAGRVVALDADTSRRRREQALSEVAARERGPDGDLIATWAERVRAWGRISDVFGDLGLLLGRGWDLALGVLRHAGWLDLVELRQLLERLPQLREIVRTLGRLHASDAAQSVAATILVPVRRLEEERRQVRTPLIPAETRGIERSGEIARMLPVEASMLGHPKLRMLWHARRAERALLTYRVEGVETERVWVDRNATEPRRGTAARRERGPIIAVIDTSGSMQGRPEQIAKAIVLEALRTAHAEKRRCLLFAYGGPGEVVEHELDLSPDGLGELLSFLGWSFGGGTEPTGAMRTVVDRLADEEWTKADVLLVSDGEFPAPTAMVSSVVRAREQGTRFHGVQVGRRGRTGLHALCDPVHEFRDWEAAGGWR